MAKEMEAPSGDEFRIMCPKCETMWTTLRVPAECPTCAAMVSFRAYVSSTTLEKKA